MKKGLFRVPPRQSLKHYIVLGYVLLFMQMSLRIRIENYRHRFQNERTRTFKRMARSELKGIKNTVVLLRHQINNALMGTLNGVLLLEERLKHDEELRPIATIVRTGSEKIADTLNKIDMIQRPKNTQYVGNMRMLDIESE